MGLSKTQKHYVLAIVSVALFFLIGYFLKKTESNALENVTVILRAKVIKDDVFQFFYQEEADEEFQIKKSVKTKVEGINRYQDIKFELPTLVNISKFRLDIGENFDQKKVTIKEIQFVKDDEEHVFDNTKFNSLFAPNKFIERVSKNKFQGKAGMANTTAIYDPFFVSSDTSEEMALIKKNPITKYPYLIAAFITGLFFLFGAYNIDKIMVSQKAIFVTLFCLMLVLPTLQNEFHLTKQLQNIEKRKLAEKPNFSFSTQYARDYEAYYDDHFGWRNHLINWGGHYRTKFFESSMHPELVMFGKDKWLFYNRMKGRIYRSYSRTNVLPEDGLKKVVNYWEENKKRYEKEGRKYFLAFWPNKHSIYPEYLPSTMKTQIKNTPSRVDQLLQYMQKNNATVRLLDPRPVLLEEKKDKLLYHKFDSHWNDYGAFLGYQQFFNTHKEALGMSPKTVQDFDIVWNDFNQGELIQMLGVHNKGYFQEKNPTFHLKENKEQIEFLPITGYPRLTKITRNKHCGNTLRALIFRDSYTNSLIQFFSLHFYEVFYIWGHQEAFVNQLQPDIIIDGFVEREIGEGIH